jgi:hypothetical protein
MILIQPREIAAPPQVKQTIPDRHPRQRRAKLIGRNQRTNQRRAHAGVHGPLIDLTVQGGVGFIKGHDEALHQTRGGLVAAAKCLRKRSRRDLRGHGTANVAAHAVAQHSQQMPLRHRRPVSSWALRPPWMAASAAVTLNVTCRLFHCSGHSTSLATALVAPMTLGPCPSTRVPRPISLICRHLTRTNRNLRRRTE